MPSINLWFSTTLSPRIRRTLLALVTVCAGSLALCADTALAQSFRPIFPFQIDLREVGRYYDTLYRDRVTGEITDSVAVYDWNRILFGNQRYTVKSFLDTDVATTREVVDYSVVPGYRVRFTVPRTHFFEALERELGDVTVREPRDYSAPEITAEFDSMGAVTEEIRERSRNQLWREYARTSVTSAVAGPDAARGGIRFNIPVPMPKSLESIFGPGDKTSITIRGREEITLAGETRVVKPFIGVEGRENQSLFPSLDMQQKLDVSLTGTIGDKVSIQVDHSSEAIGDDANRVRLAYTGYEDEIIQLIELGNTSLSLPGSQLVSVSANAQGLFGAKMLAKTGSTDFTLIASKQEGEVSNASFSPTGGSLGQNETVTIRDIDYIKNKYFYFDLPRPGITPEEVVNENEEIEVYRTVTQPDLQINPGITRLAGWVVADSAGDDSGIRSAMDSLAAGNTPAGALRQDFQFLQKDIDYFHIYDSVDLTSVVGIELAEAIPNTALKAIGVRYTRGDGIQIGGNLSRYQVPPDPEKGDILVLKMLKEPEPNPNGLFPGTWELMIRNKYSLGLTNIDGTTLEVKIVDIINPRLNPEFPDTNRVPYLRIFGLDQVDRSGAGEPDSRIDLTSGVVDLTNGIVTFPSARAFAPPSASVVVWTDGAFSFTGPFQEQYDKSTRIYTERLNATTEQEVHQYEIRVAAVSTSKTFRINALSIVENSEVITINSDRLSKGTDYDIDYLTGEVTLKESALAKLTPDARLNVEYQFKPLGGGGSSTLAGLSTATRFGDNLRFGTTALYESKSVSDNRPRLGEEPTRAMVGGITASFQHESQTLTDIANLLPYVDSDAPSTVNLDGEIAGSIPNPNTKHEAYIDDFEGVEDTDRLGMSRRSWYPASLPVEGGVTKPDTSRLDFIWYNIEPDLGVHRRDLNPELDEQENTLVQSLDLDMSEMPASGDATMFAGLMLGVAGGGLDITQGQFLEIWVNDFKPDPIQRGGQIHIDLGLIDENFFNLAETDPTEQFDDEDKDRDGFAAAFDDTGLDGLFDDEEPLLPGGDADDPAGDNIELRRIDGRYTKANGTEANILYDTEDLDRNGQMTRQNAYFSFTIDLADSASIDIRRQYPGYVGFNKNGHENDSWRLYRVKLSDHTVVSTGGLVPRFDEIRHVRVWFDDVNAVIRNDNATGSRRIQICELTIEGNRWEVDEVRRLDDEIIENPTADFAVGVISTKTDPGVYRPPIVPNRQNEVSDKESSLALRYTDLLSGQQVRILKRFTGQGLDMTLYRDLNFWVHTDALRPGVEYYFRLASNEDVWYEVRVPLTSEYFNETGWARVVVNFADLSNLKFEPTAPIVDGTATDAADPSKVYPIRMKGQPNLTGVRFLFAGVRNVVSGQPQSGEVWINDIFTGDVIRDADHAERLNAGVSFAGGALSLGGGWSRTGADYRGLRQARGTGAVTSNYGFNAKTDLQYFLPLGGFSIPITGNYGLAQSLPKFPPNSDTEILDENVADSLRTERVTRSFSTSLSRRNQSRNVVMRYTLDRLRPTFQYSDQRGISPSARDTTTSMTGSLGYQLSWSGDRTVKLFGTNRIRYWLNQIEVSTSASRQTTRRWSFVGTQFRRDPYQYGASLRNQGSVRYEPFRSLDMSFNASQVRDVGLEHEWLGINVGREIVRNHNLRVLFKAPGWWGVRLFEPSLEVQTGYNEDSGPNVRRPGDPRGTRNVSASRNDTGKMRFEVGKHLGTLFRKLGWEPGQMENRPPGGIPQTGEPPLPGAVPPDSVVVPPPDSTVTPVRPRPGVGSLVRRVGQIMVGIRPISFNLQHRENSSYARIPDRPSLGYQFGIGTDAGILVDGRPISHPDQRTENLSLNLDTSVQLSPTFDVQGRYQRATTDSDFRENRARSLNVTWPDLQANWDGVGTFRPLRPVIASGQFTVSYRETHQESGQRDQEPIQINDTFTLTPALVLAWKNELNSTLNVSYGKQENETRGSKSLQTNISANLDLKRNFRGGGGINFFGKQMKWNNELEANLIVAYSRTGGERSTAGIDLVEPIPATTSFRVAPTVRYFFSRTINGSAFIDFSRSYTEQSDQTTTIVRVGVSAVITF